MKMKKKNISKLLLNFITKMDINQIQKIQNLLTIIKELQTYTIVLPDLPPSKKNSKQIIYKNGRPIIIPSNNHRMYHLETSKTLKTAQIQHIIPKFIICTMYAPNKRAYDLSNKWETLADLFVDNAIIEDDNINFIPCVMLVSGGIDKDNPRTETTLWY